MSLVYCFAIVLLALALSARAGDDFLISHWCGPAEASRDKFAEAAEANFNVINFSSATVEENLKALDIAQELGVKVLIHDARVMAKTERQRGFKANLERMAADYKRHPALWGYYVADEPHSSEFPNLAAINKHLLKVDPRHIPFINLYPTYATTKQLGNRTYEHHVGEFLRTVRPRLLSFDHYALMRGGIRPDYFRNLEIIRRQGIKHNTPFSYILLVSPHYGYRDPSEADLRWQVNTALAYGAKGIMYFTYTALHIEDDKYGSGLLDEHGRRTPKYDYVRQINAELKKLAPTLMRLKSVAVYHTSPLPKDTKRLPKDGLIRIDGGEFVVGQFNSDRGARYAMFVNRSTEKSSRVRIRFSQEVELREVSRKTGRLRGIHVDEESGEWVWRARFAPGEGRLVRIDVSDEVSAKGWEDPLYFRPRIMLDPSAQYWNLAGSENPSDPAYYCEALTLWDIAVKVRDELARDGRVDVFLSRRSRTEPVTLKQETDITRRLNCDVLVSLHSDATGTDDPGGGTWTFYADEVEGRRLAECVQMPLLEAIKTFHPDVRFRGIRTHWYRLWVLHEAGCPGSLTEILFHSNPQEREMLKNPEYQDVMAKAIARGILDYFGLK